jgi:hypothetical protein
VWVQSAMGLDWWWVPLKEGMDFPSAKLSIIFFLQCRECSSLGTVELLPMEGRWVAPGVPTPIAHLRSVGYSPFSFTPGGTWVAALNDVKEVEVAYNEQDGKFRGNGGVGILARVRFDWTSP